MKLSVLDLEPDEVEMLNTADNLNLEIDYHDLTISQDVPVVVKYDYLDMGATDYHFRQEFTLRDTQSYFEMMRKISLNTIGSLSAHARDYHFYRTEIKGNLRKAMQQVCPGAVQSHQMVFHFVLYSDKDVVANRGTGIRCPRIYFILGTYGRIYPIFFDPYHELNPLG